MTCILLIRRKRNLKRRRSNEISKKLPSKKYIVASWIRLAGLSALTRTYITPDARAPPIDLHVWLFLSSSSFLSVCLIIRQKESAAISAAPWYREREPELLLLLLPLLETKRHLRGPPFFSLSLSLSLPFFKRVTERETHRAPKWLLCSIKKGEK
jgi:hypothetical protein